MRKKDLIILVSGLVLAAILCVVFVWKPWQNNELPQAGGNEGTNQSAQGSTGEDADGTTNADGTGSDAATGTEGTGSTGGNGSESSESVGEGGKPTSSVKPTEEEEEPIPPTENPIDPEATDKKEDDDFDVDVDDTPTPSTPSGSGGKIEGGVIDFDDLLPPEMQ